VIFRRRRKGSAPADPAGSEGDVVPGRGAGAPEDAGTAPPPPSPGPATGPGGPATGAGEPEAVEGEDKRGPFSSTREALAPVRKRHVLIASMGFMGFTMMGVLLFSAASFWWTSQPSFCGRCHVMEPYIAAWEQSAHRDVNCESCHLTPGFFGFVGGKIAGLQVVANYIRGDYEDYSFNAAVSNAACLNCHEEIMDENVHSAETGVLVSHEDIIGTGGKCMFCHSTVAHGSAVAMGSATHPTMSTCLTCHNDEIAPLDCELCHVGKNPPEEMPTEGPPVGTGG